MATAAKEKDELPEEKNMPFLEHLAELRMMLIHCSLAILPGMLFCFIFYDLAFWPFVHLLQGIPEGVSIANLSPAEKFFALLRIALAGGILLGFPVVLYEVWKFISPGLYRKEKRLVVPFILSGTILFLLGAAFCYFIALPMCVKFLVNFGSVDYGDVQMVNMWGTGAFINFALGMLLGFGAGFNLPVVLVTLNLLDIVRIDTLRKGRRYAVVLCMAVGAVLTPQDIVSMLLLAVPLYILYEGSILTIRILEWRKRKREEEGKENAAE
jgi:sec-independent protein translocase protein TatC